MDKKEHMVSKRLKIVMIVLAVLLVFSAGGLAARYIYLHFWAPIQSTVTVPDNLIREEDAESQDILAENSSQSVYNISSSNIDFSTEQTRMTSGAGSSGGTDNPAADKSSAVKLELYEGKPGDNQKFEVKNMFPGDTKTKYFCIRAHHNADLELFFKTEVTEQTKNLGDVLQIKVTHLETGKVLCDATFAEVNGSEFSELLKKNTADETTAYYQIDVSLNTSVGNEYQAASLKADFEWYVKEEGGEKSLYTKQILPGDTLSFKFIPSVTANYTFTAMWGSYSGEPNITENCTIGQRMEVQRVPEVSEPQQNSSGRKDVHIVQAEDSLWGIAAQYGTTVEKITAYNDIAQDAALQIGQEIKIPPQDYEIPSDPSSSSTLPEESSSIPEGAAESQEDGSAETSSISE